MSPITLVLLAVLAAEPPADAAPTTTSTAAAVPTPTPTAIAVPPSPQPSPPAERGQREMGASAAAAPRAEAPASPAARALREAALTLASGATWQPKLVLQPRFDAGDLVLSRDGDRRSSSQDLSLRRVRFGARGTAAFGLRWYATFDADRAGEAGRTTAAKLKDAAVEWRAADAFALRVGKAKLPYTRIGLTSSTEQLLVERPAFIEAARDLFDSATPVNVLVRSRLLDGAVVLHAALADGWQARSKPYASGPGSTVRTAGPLAVVRAELSPPGWVEDGRSDAHGGEGRHLALGGTYASQDRIAFTDIPEQESRRYAGADLSFHLGGLTAQAEVGRSRIRSALASRGTTTSRGWYAQAGWLMPGLPIELAGRYEAWREDVDVTGATREVVTAGLNLYLAGPALKVMANGVHAHFGAGSSERLPASSSQDLFQLQAQLVL